MSETNQYGLSRHIPAEIARLVRQRDGFGCVCCGQALIIYDHIDPEFSEAREHKAEGIVLLCGGCNNKKTRRVLSAESVREAARSPKAKQLGFSFEAYDVGRSHPELAVGPLVGRNVGAFIRICNEDVLSILPPEEDRGPFRINARLADRDGRIIFEIVENEWRTPTENWDVEAVGRRVTIWQRLGHISLSVRTDPPNRITFERIDLTHRGARIVASGEQYCLIISNTGAYYRTEGHEAQDPSVLVEVRENGSILIGQGGTAYARGRSRIAGPGVLRRNSLCPCNNSLRFKHCHGRHL